MPITFTCQNCQCKMTVPDALAGKKGTCSKCKGPVVVPAPVNGTVPPAQKETVKPPVTRSAPPAAPAMPAAKVETPVEPPVDLEAAAMAVLADEPEAAQAARDASVIEFECPMCNEPVKLAAEHGGKKHPCPSCKRIVAVPMPKIEKRTSWRDTGPKLPSAARREDLPELEGAWGSTKKVGPSQEALKEAGVIAEKHKPLTLMQKLRPYLLIGVPVFMLGMGALFLWDWMTSNREKQALTDAVNFVKTDSNREIVGSEGLAGLHAGLAAYYQRVGQPGNAGARDEILNAVARARDSKNPEADALLLDLSAVALDLGGSADQVGAGTHLKWDDAQKVLQSVLGGIKTPEVRLEALRRVAAGLVERGEIARAMPLAAQVYSTPGVDRSEAQAVVGIELLRLGKKDEAKQAANLAEATYAQKKGKDPPPTRAAVVALAVQLERPLDKLQQPKNSIVDEESFARGKAAGMASAGNLESALDLAGKVNSEPAETFRAKVEVVIAAAENKKADASTFDQVLANSQKGQPWVVLRLIDAALRAGVSVDRVEPAANGMSGPLAGWAQLLLLRARLAGSRSPEPVDVLDKFPAKSLAGNMARLELSRHNMRLGSSWYNTVKTWDGPAHAFGSLGVAQGFHKGN